MKSPIRISRALATAITLFLVTTGSFAQVKGQYYKIVNNVSKMALVTNGQTAKGSTVYKKDWSLAGEGGLWTFVKKGDLFAIKNKHSGLFLAAMKANAKGDFVKITNTPGPGALWKVEQDNDNMFTIINNANGMVIANMRDTDINSPAKFNTGRGPGTKWMLVKGK